MDGRIIFQTRIRFIIDFLGLQTPYLKCRVCDFNNFASGEKHE
jgi:hypothetical protein